MTKVYTQHDAAFSRVSSYAVLRNGEPVAKIAFKFPADGAGRLYAYVHWIGCEMVRGAATGYGYDKRTAACASAIRVMPPYGETDKYGNDWSKEHAACELFREALARDTGPTFDSALRDAGFTVFQTI